MTITSSWGLISDQKANLEHRLHLHCKVIKSTESCKAENISLLLSFDAPEN